MRCFAEFQKVEGVGRYQRVQRVTTLPAGITSSPGGGWVAVADGVGPETHYWDNLERRPVPYPQRPDGDGWVFDFLALAWVCDSQVLWSEVRRVRDERLQACDWRVLPDAPPSAGDRDAWLDYRQALRDITLQAEPAAIVWPVPPG